MWHGIAAHFYWRQVVLIVAVIVVVPIVLLPLYQQRASEIIGSQGEVFASTTLGSTSEALYKQDFTFVIQYTQRVLKNTDQILQVILKSRDGRIIRIDAEQWSLADAQEYTDLPAVKDEAFLYRADQTAAAAFTYASPIVIATYYWGDIYIDIDSSAYQQLIRNFWTGYAVVSIALLLGSMAFLWLSARPLVRQLAELRTVAGEIGEGRFAQANENGIGEIAGLALALNSMTDSLQEKTRQVHQLARVVRETNEAFMLFDAGGKSLFANEAMTKLLNQTEARLMREDLWSILDRLALDSDEVESVRKGIASPKGLIWSADTRYKKAGAGTQMAHLAVKLEVLSKTRDALSGFVLALSDITARKELERRLERLALYDTLTGLPNRRSFGLEIERLVAVGKPFSVLFMDLDHFKTVNDSLGHESGDQLLIIAGKRLIGCTPSHCMVARLGGDEFTAIVDTNLSDVQMESLARGVIETLEEPILVSGRSVNIGVSIGIVHFPDNGDTAAELVKNADIAMYEVKKRGRNDFCVFSDTMQHRVSESLSIEVGLRKAIKDDELELVYQPIVRASDRSLVSAEALVRWPARNIPPSVFVSIAERSNLIEQLDEWVFRSALQQLAAWHANAKPIQLSINVSGRHVSQADFAPRFLEIVEQTGASLSSIQLEITENNLVDSKEVSIATLTTLRDAGCRIAVDDFGTGYSSLSYLTGLPINVVKLDKSFTLNREGDLRAKSIAKAVINLSRDLELTTIAEGVESEQQAAQLAEQGCHCLQGYHIARPMPASQFELDWLAGVSATHLTMIRQQVRMLSRTG